MKQNNNTKNVMRNIKTDAANTAKTTNDGTPITADRLTEAEQHAKRRHIVAIKRLVDAWRAVRESGAGDALLRDGSAWRDALQTLGLSVLDHNTYVPKDARAAADMVTARYEAGKAASDRKPLQVVVDVITQDGLPPVNVEDAMRPLVDTVDAAQVWQNYNAKVRAVPTKNCKLVDILPLVSARDVLTVSEIAARLPEDKRGGAAEVQRKVKSVLLAKSKAYAAYTASDLQAVKTHGSEVVHIVNYKYNDGAKGKAQ